MVRLGSWTGDQLRCLYMNGHNDEVTQQNAIEVFAILNKQQIAKITNIVDESVISESSASYKLDKLKKMGFTESQALNIMECFFNFYLGLQHPNQIKNHIDHQHDLSNDAKQLALDAFEHVLAKSDKQKIQLNLEYDAVRNFGHAHLSTFKVIPDFRPIVINGQLKKMAVAIVIHGHVNDDQHQKFMQFNFQTDIDGFKKLIREFNDQLQKTEMTIKELSEKLGGDISIG